MARTLIIGYGSLLRGDDALGRIAAGQLAAEYAGDASVSVCETTS
jgi:Ni,Fe-hydrogenase maturation factor